MKILFICGSIEPGRDGVGDYTVKLAAELIQQGYTSTIIAINDSHITTYFCGHFKFDNTQLDVIRLPCIWHEKHRYNCVKIWIENHNPDWISLQFVLYAFKSNGLPFYIGNKINKMIAGRNLHIMFHELWVGIENSRWVKTAIVSMLQKGIIRQLLRKTKPSVVHTNLPFYQQELADLGYHVKILKLFSNIDKLHGNNESESKNLIRVGLFGQVEIYKSIILFLKTLKAQADSMGVEFEVLLIGGSETRMKLKAMQMKKLLNDDFIVHFTGYLTPPTLSKALQSCTLGLTSVPRHCLGKSGTVAAFIAHGIPVAAPYYLSNYCPDLIGFSSNELCKAILLEPTLEHINKLKANILNTASEIKVSTVAKTFISDLKKHHEART